MRGRTDGICAFGGRPRLYPFLAIYLTCVLRFAFFGARRVRRSKSGVLAASHLQGSGMVFDAGKPGFEIASARKRPILALLPSGACAHTPLDGPEMHFSREPDVAGAPKTPQIVGFRHERSAAHICDKSELLHFGTRPKTAFPRENSLRSVAGNAYRNAPQEHFFGPEMSTNECHSARVDTPGTQVSAQNPQWVGSQAARLDYTQIWSVHAALVLSRTRVIWVQNDQKNVIFRLPPLL